MRIRYAALAVAVVVAGYVGYWFWVAGKVERGVLRWADERRAEGFEVGWRSFDIGGFPFRLVLTFEEPRLAQPGHRLAPEWRGERVIALMYPWNLRYVLAGFEGEQTLSFRDEGATRRIAVRAERWRASWRSGDATRLSIDLNRAAARDSAAAEPIRAERLQIHARPGQRPGALADVAVKAEGLRLPEAEASPLGPQIAQAELDATVMGPLVAGGYPEAVLRWRDEGGVLEVRRAALHWGEVEFEATGTVTLDAETRPEGAFTAKVRNHRRLTAALTDAGALSANDARLAGAALDLLAAANAGAVSAPLTLQNGKAWLGPAEIARLSPLLPAGARNPAPESPAPRR